MSFEEDHNDAESSATENFRESINKFTFTTPCQPQVDPAVTTADSSKQLLTLRRSSRVAASVTSGRSVVRRDSHALSLPLSRKGKRKAPDASLSKDAVKKLKRGYAPPEAYSHLSPLTDCLAYGLDVVFCGINPGYMSAQRGHHFAHPTNHFWKCLYHSGFTSRLLPPSEDHSLPEKFNIGLTDLVDRPSTEASELSSSERVSSVPILLNKLALHRPRFLCLVGKSNWEVVQKALVQMSTGPSKASRSSGTSKASRASANNTGLQPFKLCYPAIAGPSTSANISETLLFVVSSTSGRVVQYKLSDKVKLFTQLKSLVDQPRSELNTSEMKCITMSHDP